MALILNALRRQVQIKENIMKALLFASLASAAIAAFSSADTMNFDNSKAGASWSRTTHWGPPLCAAKRS